MVRRKIVVATSDPVTSQMAGPAIRAWHIADQLAKEHDVHLVTTNVCDRNHEGFAVSAVDADGMRALEEWMDILVFQGGLLRIHPFLVRSEKVIVADVYDPFHLENLEQTRGRSPEERFSTIDHLTGVLDEQLQRADFLLCASESQRDFWMGSLATLRRINPSTYDADPTLRSLIAVAPFGVPSDPPPASAGAIRGVVDGIAEGDAVLLWAGGVYNWFDPLTLVRAVDALRHRVPSVRLFFLGMGHPNPDIPAMKMAADLRALSDRLGLTGRHVFFNERWVDYDERHRYLIDADVGVSTHLAHVETAYSFRTRILDYLWAGLPVVATGGDAFASLIDGEGVGITVPAGDVDALENALYTLLTDASLAEAARVASHRVSERFHWDEALRPLVEFCRDPHRAADAERRASAERAQRVSGPTEGDPPGLAAEAGLLLRRAVRTARAAAKRLLPRR